MINYFLSVGNFYPFFKLSSKGRVCIAQTIVKAWRTWIDKIPATVAPLLTCLFISLDRACILRDAAIYHWIVLSVRTVLTIKYHSMMVIFPLPVSLATITVTTRDIKQSKSMDSSGRRKSKLIVCCLLSWLDKQNYNVNARVVHTDLVWGLGGKQLDQNSMQNWWGGFCSVCVQWQDQLLDWLGPQHGGV